MTANPALRGLNRRALLARAAMAGAALAIGSGFVAAPDAAWALEVTHLKPETMATLIQMARDIYPHDRLSENFYAVAVKGYDSEAEAAGIEAGIAALNAAAAAPATGTTCRSAGKATGWPCCAAWSRARSSRRSGAAW